MTTAVDVPAIASAFVASSTLPASVVVAALTDGFGYVPLKSPPAAPVGGSSDGTEMPPIAVDSEAIALFELRALPATAVLKDAMDEAPPATEVDKLDVT